MCGIVGIYNSNDNKVNPAVLKRMSNAIIHRGPDDEGSYVSNNLALAMRRLSIIDLSTGHQPIHNEDKTLWVVFNGEIYNFQKLRDKLKDKHKFTTKTDTEVILHLYEEYGAECVSHLRGMFAFAIWDEKKKALFIARDRLGKKPLYYTNINNSFYFASEIKSFLQIPDFKRQINLKAIHYYLTYQYIPGPMTIWKDVFRLEPASYMTVNSMLEQKTEKYWDVSFKKKTDLNFTDAKAELKRILTEATSIRMISDVPLGAFLSGGVDSSIIVGLMSRLSSKPIKTFSIGFEDKEFSELKYASIIAKQFNTDHHELIVKPNYVDMLKKIVWHYDQPYADCSALPSYIVSQMTRKHVTVALNGDGGDESFAGYLRFKALKISEYTSLPMKLVPQFVIKQVLNHLPMNESVDASKLNRYFHRFIQPLKEPPQRRNLIWHAYFTNELKSFIYSEDMKKAFICDDAYSYLENIFMSPQADNTLDRALYTDLTSYLPENLLIKMDIASMANSLEARSPFLDHELVEFAATLPPEWKLKFFNSKYILKETFKDILPQEILNRQKQGFSIPLGKWFRGELKDYLRDVILSSKALNRGYFDPKNLKVLVNDHIEGKADYGYCLWALLMLELWHIVFIDSEVQ